MKKLYNKLSFNTIDEYSKLYDRYNATNVEMFVESGIDVFLFVRLEYELMHSMDLITSNLSREIVVNTDRINKILIC